MFPAIYMLLIAFSDIAVPATAIQIISGKQLHIKPSVFSLLLLLLVIGRYFIPISFLFFEFFIFLFLLLAFSQLKYKEMLYPIGFFLILNIIIVPIVNILYLYLFNGYYEYQHFFSNILPNTNVEFICKMLLLLILLHVQNSKIPKNDTFEKKYWHSMYLFSLLCFLSLLLLMGFSSSNLKDEYSLFYSTLSGIIILLLYMFNNFFKSLYSNILEKQQILLEQQKMKLELNSLLDLHNHVEEIKKINHDRKNNFIVLQHLLENNEIEQANTYLKQYIEIAETASKGLQIDNTIANALVNSKIRKYPNLTFDTKCFIPPKIALNDLDFVTILGNLLDNAAEYLDRHPIDDTVYIKILTHMDSILFIEIKNRCLEESMQEEVKTEKKDKLNHGYGLMNVKNVIEKHKGTYSHRIENHYYTVRIMIPDGGRER